MIDQYIDKKLKFSLKVVFLSAFLCGVIMGLVSMFSIVAANITDNKILGKFLYGIAFTGLLFLTLINGYDLFTGNTMILIRVRRSEERKKILLNVLLVYLGNFVGCLLMAGIFHTLELDKSFKLTDYLAALYTTKTTLSWWKMILLGVLANYLVCMGVFLGLKGKTSVQTYINLFFPITIFCVLGCEHSVANMFSLFYAAFATSSAIGPVFVNLAIVTVGNIIGGVCLALSTKVKDKLVPVKDAPKE